MLFHIKQQVSKNELLELENKVFPIVKEVVKRTKQCSEKIDDTCSQMIRYDEILLDCAKNIDIRDLKNKINSCVRNEIFE